MPRFLYRTVAVFLLPLLLATSCGWPPMARQLREPDRVQEVAQLGQQGFLKAHLRDGGVRLFTSWTVDQAAGVPGGTVRGHGWAFDAQRHLRLEGEISAPLDSVVLFESNLPPQRLHPAVQALLIVTGVAVGLVLTAAAILAACGKNCTGSCPTFYVWDGQRLALAAEGFSASVAPSLEATDIDALSAARPTSREFDIEMLNEALETHVVRSVRVLAAPHAPGEHVFAVPGGSFRTVDRLIEPRQAIAPEGDCTAALRTLDGAERTSRTDSTDLAARERIELDFDGAPGGRAGLVIGMRQTLVTTYLFYQALAWMGHSAGDWIAALETGGPSVRNRVGGAGKILGGIGIEVLDPKRGWVSAGQVFETGPIATDVHLVPLPDVAGGVKRVRLSMAKGLWRLDYVALARMGAEVSPLRLDPVRVMRGATRDDDALAALTDSPRTLISLPGDRFSLTYRLPENYRDCDLFLESRGYYLEWIRKEWYADENSGRVISMLMNPRGMLRSVAPAFKKQEAAQEALFWQVIRGHL